MRRIHYSWWQPEIRKKNSWYGRFIPLVYKVLGYIPGGVVWDFWTIKPYFTSYSYWLFQIRMIGSDFGMRVNKPAETVEKKTRFRLVSPNLSQKKHVESDMWTKLNSRIFAGGDLTVAGLGHQLSKPWRIHGTVIFTYMYNNNLKAFIYIPWMVWEWMNFVDTKYLHCNARLSHHTSTGKVCVLKLKNKVSLVKQNH